MPKQMKHRHYLLVVLCLILLASALWTPRAKAQVQEDWSSLLRLSANRGKASEASLVADKYGNVHVFWTEELPDERLIIQYSVYNGVTWSAPTDIRLTEPFRSIGNVSPVVDSNGTLHIMWSESDIGPAFYMSAPAHAATSAQNWQEPRLLQVPANRIKLQVDSKGFLHVLYMKFLEPEQGIYYLRSEDQGISWSDPLWLDPDVLPDHGPRSLNFEMDDSGGLHAAWYYVPHLDVGGDWVRYAHSLDGGNTWSQPFTIDRLDEQELANGETLSAAGPVMAVQGQNVHIVWAGGIFHYRHHRYSTDAGRTWSTSRRIFGELNGQAFDGLTVDAAGRVHFFGQIRFPMGIYHAVWDEGQWTQPALIYLIRYTSTDLAGDKVQAHNTHPAVRAGNQLVLTFADEPSEPERKLYVIQRTMDDVPELRIAPTPSPTPTPSSTPVPPTPTPLPTSTPVSFGNADPPTVDTSARQPLWMGIVPPLLLCVTVMAFRMLTRRR